MPNPGGGDASATLRNGRITFNGEPDGQRRSVEPHTTADTCVSCDRHSDDPDREGWHVFSDGADEQYALCPDCARPRAGAASRGERPVCAVTHHSERFAAGCGTAALLLVPVLSPVQESKRVRRCSIVCALGSRLPTVEARYELQARNEALMRTVNDRIKALDEEAGPWPDREELFGFHCECGNTDSCNERVHMSLAEYERVRSQRDRFAVVPGHQADEIEQVVEQNDRFLIVDKRDAVEHLVE